MSEAKFNVWIRDQSCEIVHRLFHLHVYDCRGMQVFSHWFSDGHAEFKMPPGCYIMRAGMFPPPPATNIYTDRAMVIAKCGEEACVNLILPRYVELPPVPPPIQPVRIEEDKDVHANFIAKGGCAPAVILALGVEALQKGINPKEAFDVIMKTAEIDSKQMIAAIENEIQYIRKNVEKVSKEEREEISAYEKHLENIKKMIEK